MAGRLVGLRARSWACRSTIPVVLTLAFVVACGSPAARDDDTGGAAARVGRDPVLWPFSFDSPWNMPVGDGLVLAEGECTRAVRDPAGEAWVNIETWSHPLYRATGTDPRVDIVHDGVVEATWSVPSGASPSLPAYPEGDAHMHVVDAPGETVTESWRARPVDGGWAVDSWARVDLRGSGVGTDGVRIYGGSAIGGLLRAGEVGAGARHAVAVSLPLEDLAPTFTWPATVVSSGRDDEMSGVVPVGQHLALPADVDEGIVSTAAGLALLRALRDYGGYVVDHAGNFAVYAEFGADEWDGARDDIDAIHARLACSTNNSEASPGGPGDRVAPYAPPFE